MQGETAGLDSPAPFFLMGALSWLSWALLQMIGESSHPTVKVALVWIACSTAIIGAIGVGTFVRSLMGILSARDTGPSVTGWRRATSTTFAAFGRVALGAAAIFAIAALAIENKGGGNLSEMIEVSLGAVNPIMISLIGSLSCRALNVQRPGRLVDVVRLLVWVWVAYLLSSAWILEWSGPPVAKAVAVACIGLCLASALRVSRLIVWRQGALAP